MAPVAEEIYELIKQRRSERSTLKHSYEQKWIQKKLKDPHLAELAGQLSIIPLHVLSALQDGEKTGIKLANQLNVTRGGITRAAKKLEQSGLISSQKHLDDHKKIYYSLTQNGAEIAKVHDEMHEELRKNMVKEMSHRFSEQQLQVVLDFLQELDEMEKNF